MHIGIKLLYVLAGSLIISGCTETKDVNPADLGSSYFPLKVGNFSIFQVDGVQYNNFSDSAAFSYQLRESVVDSFQNLELGISYKILIEKRPNEATPWSTDSIWTARKDALRAIRVENNIPVIYLTFPLKENKTWNANGLNDKPSDNFEMVKVRDAFTGAFQTFNETVTVIQEYIPDKVVNFISLKEIYSKDVGLVYKENIILKYRQDDLLGKEIIDSGIKYYQSLIEHGEE